MNIRAKLIGCLFAVSVMFITSVPVYAAPGDGVIFLADAEAASYVAIIIDGVYEDWWVDKPHTDFFYGDRTETNYHLGALFRGTDRGIDYVYLHIKTSIDAPDFIGGGYLFTVDSEEYEVYAVLGENGEIKVGNTDLVIRSQSDNTTIAGADGFVTHHVKKLNLPDEWELKIPLSYFSSTPENIRTIEFSCVNLGPQVLTSTGTPTWPFVVAGSGLIIAFAGYRQLSKRKRSK